MSPCWEHAADSWDEFLLPIIIKFPPDSNSFCRVRPPRVIVAHMQNHNANNLKDRELFHLPQPLQHKAEVHVQVELPAEARQLMADIHDDRTWIGGCVAFSLVLAALATFFLGVGVCRYVFSRKGEK